MEVYGTVHLRYPAFAFAIGPGLPGAVALLPGVIAADVTVVAQETGYERGVCLLETVARCKIESPPRGFAVALGKDSKERCR